MHSAAMSEDQRSTRSKKVLVVANPDSGDSDNANESHRRPQPAPVRPTHAYTHPPHRAYNPYPRPQPSVVPPSLYRQQISPEQYYAQDIQHYHSLSAPPTEHPAYPEPASRSPPAVDYPQQQAFSINVAPLTLRKGNKLLPSVRAPLGSRPKESSSTQNGVRRLAARSVGFLLLLCCPPDPLLVALSAWVPTRHATVHASACIVAPDTRENHPGDHRGRSLCRRRREQRHQWPRNPGPGTRKLYAVAFSISQCRPIPQSHRRLLSD